MKRLLIGRLVSDDVQLKIETGHKATQCQL